MNAYNFTSKGKPVTIYAISTGTVAMKTRAHTIRHNNLALRLIDIMADKEFTNELPVYCWLVKHPEGNFIIDTGYSHEVNRPDYLAKAKALEKWFSRTQVTPHAKKEDELLFQLNLLGIGAEQIDAVIFTHLHVDHVGGIPGMRGAKFIVNKTELDNNSQAFLLPKWFEPVKAELQNKPAETFGMTYTLTEAADMHLVHTPGHTPGHCSVLLQTDEVDILFAGDVVYDAEQLISNTIAAPNDLKSSMKSYQNIRDYGSRRPLIVLPSHDERSLQRLEHPFENLIGDCKPVLQLG